MIHMPNAQTTLFYQVCIFKVHLLVFLKRMLRDIKAAARPYFQDTSL